MEMQQGTGVYKTIMVKGVTKKKTKNHKPYVAIMDENDVWYNDFTGRENYIREEVYQVKTEAEGGYRNIVFARLIDMNAIRPFALISATIIVTAKMQSGRIEEKEVDGEIESYMNHFMKVLIPKNLWKYFTVKENDRG